MNKLFIVKQLSELYVTDLQGSDGLKGCYRDVVFTDINGDNEYDITLTGGDARLPLEVGQQVLADLRWEHFKYNNEWKDEYFVNSISPLNIKRKKPMQDFKSSSVLPLENQFHENWGWEDSYEFYKLDYEFKDLEYFTKMNDEELIHLIRKMDNFMTERGISDCFMRNYALADTAFRKMCDSAAASN